MSTLPLLGISSIATGCPDNVVSWDLRRSSFFLGGGGGWQQTCVEKHLTVANCLYISGVHQTPVLTLNQRLTTPLLGIPLAPSRCYSPRLKLCRPTVITSSIATGRHVPTCSGHVGSWDVTRSEVFWGYRGDGGRTRQQTYVEKHFTAANCIYLASRAKPPDPHWGSAPGLHWRISSPRPFVPTLTSEPGYATGHNTITSTHERMAMLLGQVF